MQQRQTGLVVKLASTDVMGLEAREYRLTHNMTRRVFL